MTDKSVSPPLVIQLAKRNRSFLLPDPVSDKLDRLQDAARRTRLGSHVSRQEVVAALIHAAKEDSRALERLLHAYRSAHHVSGEVVELHRLRPGPRPNKASANDAG